MNIFSLKIQQTWNFSIQEKSWSSTFYTDFSIILKCCTAFKIDSRNFHIQSLCFMQKKVNIWFDRLLNCADCIQNSTKKRKAIASLSPLDYVDFAKFVMPANRQSSKKKNSSINYENFPRTREKNFSLFSLALFSGRDKISIKPMIIEYSSVEWSANGGCCCLKSSSTRRVRSFAYLSLITIIIMTTGERGLEQWIILWGNKKFVIDDGSSLSAA